ncbi:hypothetical protein [Brachybacterium fresconis]|uniref:Uncharacterized protein n=1 Tax=Brachybacterium fresconis TaxID=173363 RepID=A0ABS4YIX3_9MICO|nr:hypothetical protein [Brachybacterium fresconis]MBP2408694.1 hypothetical protein [Brachybacterium fresconis]
MKHPLVPSIEVLGALPLSHLNDQSIYGNRVEPIVQLDSHDRVAARRYQQELPSQVLYVDRLPRRRSRPDCIIGVGFIVAWATPLGVAQGVLLEDFDDALEFGRLAMKGLHSAHSFLFRAASITKWNPTTEVDDRSIVVDAEALEWQPGSQVQWASPLEIHPAKYSRR